LMIAGFWLVYCRGGRLGSPSPESRQALIRADASQHLGDRNLLRISLIVLGLTVIGFFLHGALHYQAGTIAVFGAVTLLLVSRIDPHDVLADVEWSTIFFFVGLFIVVGGIEKTGLMDLVAGAVIGIVGGDVALAALGLLWFAGISSAIVDNIPAVATLIPLTFSMARLLFPELAGLENFELAAHPSVTPLWWSLALGACLGGNGTLVGASANVVAVGIAERRGDHIGFWGFTRIGLPFALVSLIVSSIYVWVRYLAGT
jgi:Na+/H+ antiporter NhaD/arsenite permease-like protein